MLLSTYWGKFQRFIFSEPLVRPLFREISYIDAQHFSLFLEDYANFVYLHSAQFDVDRGRYSYIALDPIKVFSARDEQIDSVLTELSTLLQTKHETIAHLPPFQGGLAGFISYDCARHFEVLPNLAKRESNIPDLKVGLYDLIVSFDHMQKKAWIVGLSESRLNWLAEQIKQSLSRVAAIPAQQTKINITSNFTEKEYLAAVEKVIDYIRQGDIFEANISQQFSADLPDGLTPYQLFQKLMSVNPAPFAAYLQFDDWQIASSSPERFLKISDKNVEVRPIKGTIRRSENPVEDAQLAEQLLQSEKDHAENAMIVDLMRNDLSKICEPHSVIVEKLCGLESFATVHHLVSVITAKLKAEISFKQLLTAVIPGGSITGAPKIRTMEIIEELEPNRRGVYCGNAFYYGFNQQFDSSILIRTFAIENKRVRFQAGGAVVLDSDPKNEYEETLIKAQPLMRALST